MDLKEYLTDYSLRADKTLRKFFSERKKEASKIDSLSVEVMSSLENFIYGGKKVRGALTVLGYQMVGGKDFSRILPVSIAVEIMHSSLLIHDDFIDNDKFRRGKPTLHEIYSKGNTGHYGASIALIIGDLGIFLSNQLIAESNFKSDLKIKALIEFQKLLVNTGYGEILDIAFDKRENLSWDEILKVRIYKTAHYTFVMPLAIGAILGGASEDVLKNIEKYGGPVGVGFQIRDDILGVFGDTKITGKSNESDIKEGKSTFLYVKATELAKKSDKEFLHKWYGSKNLTKTKIEKVRELIKEIGALDYSQNLALKLAKEGKAYIPKMTQNSKYREILSNLADFVVTRDK